LELVQAVMVAVAAVMVAVALGAIAAVDGAAVPEALMGEALVMELARGLLPALVVAAQFVSFGRAQLVNSRQQTQVICNETLYSN